MSIDNPEIAFRLFFSFLLGGIIGLEREKYQRPAGFRTHILVCLGSTLVMLVSVYGLEEYTKATGMNRDPARMAAQVVSGIGFLGAGTILREGYVIKGLTTAASLWVVAGIGLAVGVGFYFAATITTFFTFFALLVLYRLEQRWLVANHCNHLVVDISDGPGRIGAITTVLGAHGINIKDIKLLPGTDEGNIRLELFVMIPTNVQKFLLIEEMARLDGVILATFSEGEV